MGTIKGRYPTRNSSNIYEFYDDTTEEIIQPAAPVYFTDDFNGPATLDTFKWTAIDVSAGGNTTPLVVPNGANGVLRLPLDVTSEAQESGIHWGDQRSLVLDQNLNFQCRLAVQTLPTLLSEAVWGLAGDKNAVADTVAEAIWFKVDGSGAVVVESDDTVNEQTDISTGTTLTAGTNAIFLIDCSTITDCKFFINGEQVATGTTFDMSTVSALALQPYFHIAKASGAGLGVLDVDKVDVWQHRS